MELHNVTGFLKWHIRNFKFTFTKFIFLDVVFIFGNIFLGDPSSKWYIINAMIGVSLILIPLLAWIIKYEITKSYNSYIKEKQNLINMLKNVQK